MYEKEIQSTKQQLHLKTKWIYFFSFVKDNLNQTVGSVMKMKNKTSYIFSSSRTMILDVIKTWKSRTFKEMKASNIPTQYLEFNENNNLSAEYLKEILTFQQNILNPWWEISIYHQKISSFWWEILICQWKS